MDILSSIFSDGHYCKIIKLKILILKLLKRQNCPFIKNKYHKYNNLIKDNQF